MTTFLHDLNETVTRPLIDIVLERAPREFTGEPTHRGTLFFRNRSEGDSFEKVLLKKEGAFWVSQEGKVWYNDDQGRIYFHLPIIANGEVVIRNGDRSIFDHGELDRRSIQELTGEEPRQWTQEEMTDRVLKHFIGLARYWEKVQLSPSETPPLRHRLEGLLFSILSSLDGSPPELPGFQLVSAASEEDREFNLKMGDNWWPIATVDEEVQLLWPLHERFHTLKAVK